MTKLELYEKTSFANSETITRLYSTSFATAIKLLAPRMRTPIHGIYGFVRLADEIVDTFHQTNQGAVLAAFKTATFEAIENQFSINPVLHAFQVIVNRYGIDHQLIHSFFKSMEMDLYKKTYESYEEYSSYIYGSAEVVGLMCLPILCDNNHEQVNALKDAAKSLGAAFQKINFLRDVQEDFKDLNRVYFPNIDFNNLDDNQKKQLLLDIDKDFQAGLAGIKLLPIGSRFGVYVAYRYYRSLFDKIDRLPARVILQQRVRVPDFKKLLIIFDSYFRFQLNTNL